MLAEYFQQAVPGSPYPSMNGWSKQIFWGNKRVHGGVPVPGATAWGAASCGAAPKRRPAIMSCGATTAPMRRAAAWCWGNSFDDNIVWGSSYFDNIVWGNKLTSTTSSGATRRR